MVGVFGAVAACWRQGGASGRRDQPALASRLGTSKLPADRLVSVGGILRGWMVASAATLIIVGRVVFGAFFLIAGIRNFLHFGERREMPTNYGWKLPASIMAAGFAAQLVGGLALVFGIWTVPGAIALIVFLVLATSLYHNLFLFQGKERDPHLYLTLVNVTLAAGLLLVIADSV